MSFAKQYLLVLKLMASIFCRFVRVLACARPANQHGWDGFDHHADPLPAHQRRGGQRVCQAQVRSKGWATTHACARRTGRSRRTRSRRRTVSATAPSANDDGPTAAPATNDDVRPHWRLCRIHCPDAQHYRRAHNPSGIKITPIVTIIFFIVTTLLYTLDI